MLIGREYEQMRLKEAYSSKRSEFVAEYGLRRVGKTYLIHRMFDGRFFFWRQGFACVDWACPIVGRVGCGDSKRGMCRGASGGGWALGRLARGRRFWRTLRMPHYPKFPKLSKTEPISS